MRDKATIKSELGDIPGIGAMRQRELLKFFGSVEKIREVTFEELTKAPKMNAKAARVVYDFFHPGEN